MKSGYEEYRAKDSGLRWRVIGKRGNKLANGGESYTRKRGLRAGVIATVRELLRIEWVVLALRPQIKSIAQAIWIEERENLRSEVSN